MASFSVKPHFESKTIQMELRAINMVHGVHYTEIEAISKKRAIRPGKLKKIINCFQSLKVTKL